MKSHRFASTIDNHDVNIKTLWEAYQEIILETFKHHRKKTVQKYNKRLRYDSIQFQLDGILDHTLAHDFPKLAQDVICFSLNK